MTDHVRSILCLGDVHAGSPYAVSDPYPILINAGNEANEVHPNKGQLQLYKHWEHMLDMADEFNCDTVINLGDTIDGGNHYEGGRGVMTPDIEFQKDLAVRLLKPVVKDRKYVCVSPSQYHNSWDTKAERQIAQRLEGVAEQSLYVGVTGIITVPEVNKKLLIAHKASNAMLYTATMLDRELIYQKVAEANKQLPGIDYRITAHLHKAMHLDNGRQHYLQLPCWKSYYPIKSSTRLIGRYQTDIGFAIILFDGEGRSMVKLFVYESPNIAIREASV